MSAFRQIVVVDRPPVWDRCVEAFGREQLEGKPVVFAWGRKLFNPTNAPIPRPLAAHEAVHGQRQEAYIDFPGYVPSEGDVANDERITAWWERYLCEPLFRLDEEIYAHRAEYEAYLRRHGPRRSDLEMIAGRLSGPLYGNLLDYRQARHAVLTGEVQ